MGLIFGNGTKGGPSPDRCIIAAALGSPSPCDQPGKKFSQERREIDDVRIGEKIDQKGLHIVLGFGATEIEKEHSNAITVLHRSSRSLLFLKYGMAGQSRPFFDPCMAFSAPSSLGEIREQSSPLRNPVHGREQAQAHQENHDIGKPGGQNGRNDPSPSEGESHGIKGPISEG